MGIDRTNFLKFIYSEQESAYIPERSRFYNLEPIGIGTTDVESFSGYVSRLAQEHLVSPVVLIKNSVSKLDQLPQVFREDSLPQLVTTNLNGYGDNSEKLVEIFQKATFRDDIRLTTLSAWKDKISYYKLLKKNLSWCPSCFQDSLESNLIIYEKLLWNFEVVKICSIHQIVLSEICPSCRCKLKILSGRSRPGFCSKCLSWLGRNSFTETVREDSKELWIARNIGGLLLSDTKITYSLPANLKYLIELKANGNINDFAHSVGVWHLAVRRLLKSEVLPTLEMLVDICYPLDFSIVDLFVKNAKGNQTKSKSSNLSNPSTKAEVEITIMTAFDEIPPPSLNEVCRRIGWTSTRFQRHFPDAYKRIVERYLQSQAEKLPEYSNDEVEKILLKAVTENPPPSLQSVFRRIGCRNTGFRYYERFPELCEQISKRYKQANHKVFNSEKAEQILKSALKEKLIPSFSEVARRIGCKRETLNKNFPKLSERLHQKYADYVKESREQNKRELREEINRVILELQNQGASITESSVRKLMIRKWNDKNFKQTYKEIRGKLD